MKKIIEAVDGNGDRKETEESVVQVLEVFSNLIVAGLQDTRTEGESSYVIVEETDSVEVEELSKNIVDQVENIGKIVADNQVLGEGPSVVETSQVTVIGSKTSLSDVGGKSSSLIHDDIGFTLGAGFAAELSNETNSSEILQTVYSFKSNPYYYSKTSERVNSKVVGLAFKTTSNEEIGVVNLPDNSQVVVSLPRSVNTDLNATEVTATSRNYTFLQLNLSTLLTDEAISIEIVIVDSYHVNSDDGETSTSDSEALDVFFLQHEGPTDSEVTSSSHLFALNMEMFTKSTNVSHQNYTIFLLAR